MPDDRATAHKELALTEEREAVIEPQLWALLAALRILESAESFELEPVTNARRWWLDDNEN